MDVQGLKKYADAVFYATLGLMKLVPEDRLGWKPASDNNWMTLGQLLFHLPETTGFCMQGFVTGTWPEAAPPPEGYVPDPDAPPGMPPAEAMPTVSSVAEAMEKMQADQKHMHDLLGQVTAEDFSSKMLPAPWNPTPQPLWVHLLFMVEHQVAHKQMLFAYLKLLGVDVNTMTLYGGPEA